MKVSEKDNVESVTVVENNQAVINLFTKYILPQFKNGLKIKSIRSNAFKYAEKHMANGSYDFVFTGLWHEVSDGIDMYLKMKEYESLSPDTVFLLDRKV